MTKKVSFTLRAFILGYCFLLQSEFAYSADVKTEKDPHHLGLLSSVNLGIRYSSLLENRGVIFYRDFQIDPVLGLFFLDDKIEFLGDSLGYRDYVAGKWLRWRSRLVSISDDPLFPVHEKIRMNMPNRSDTLEWSNRLEFFFPEYSAKYKGELDLGYSKDFSAHNGHYFELQTKIKLFDFKLPVSHALIEPNFHLSIGWGDSSHNKYFYGPSADRDGFNNLSYGIWFSFPEEADRFYPIIQITHFEVLGRNKNAEFAENNNEGWLFSFIATYGVLE